MRQVAFGSAQLLVDRMPVECARALLEAAVACGTRRLDTAPLYGHGRAEALVGSIAAVHRGVVVTTKVGLDAVPPPPPWRRHCSAVLRRLPALRAALGRGRAPPQADGPSGRFGIDAVRRSIERSLVRLGRVDRLLLHEVHPADIDEPLLRLLSGYRDRGDVAVLGVATGNAVTAEALRRGGGLFGVAHVSIDPLAPSVVGVPDGVRLVGHGALGPAGRTLQRVRDVLRTRPQHAAGWRHAVAGTPFEGDGVAAALLARAASTGPGELLVATRSREHVSMTVAAAAGLRPLPAAVRRQLDDLLLLAGAPT